MKKLLSIIMCAVIGITVGCKSVPTADKMYNISYSIGVSTGMVLNITKISDSDGVVIIDIVNEVKYYIPETNQTFKSAWTPIAENYIKKLVDDGKIDGDCAEMIISAFSTVCDGIDYLFDKRYPEARKYTELVESAVHGFTTGFLTVYVPANVLSLGNMNYDNESFNYLMNNR